MIWLVIGVAAVILIGGAAVVFSARRSDTTDSLSRETRASDAGSAVADESSKELVAVGAAAGGAGAAGGALATRPEAAVTRYEPLDEETVGVTRRQFLNRAILAVLAVPVLGTFSIALIGFLWPTAKTGFGGNIKAGQLDTILANIADSKKPYYVPEARTYVVPYPTEDVAKANVAYGPQNVKLMGMNQGIVALYQRCVHLGCRVPFCQTSQWFECPCHGSKYSRVGEKKSGPAPRGLDRFPVEVTGGSVTIVTNLATLIAGPKPGTDTTGQGAEGPSCV